MRLTTNFQAALFALGGLLMVCGACCYALMWHQKTFCWVFAAGTLLFTLMQYMQPMDKSSLTLRRLSTLQTLAGISLLLSAALMIDNQYHYLLPLFRRLNDGYQAYITYVFNKWVVLLLIGAILEIYTTHRIAHELKNAKTP